MISKSPETLKTVQMLPLQAETSSLGAVEYGCQGNLRWGKQQSGISHGCLSQKVISALPQGFWILEHREPRLQRC